MTCTRSAKPQPPKLFQSTCHIRGMTELRARSIGAFIISIHMPHTWHDVVVFLLTRTVVFQSTCHIRGMTQPDVDFGILHFISIHMPHTWHDAARRPPITADRRFQSTCHIRGMTWGHPPSATSPFPFQSTCHIRGMTMFVDYEYGLFDISIHMPHTWHDPFRRKSGLRLVYFNPHATYVA